MTLRVGGRGREEIKEEREGEGGREGEKEGGKEGGKEEGRAERKSFDSLIIYNYFCGIAANNISV